MNNAKLRIINYDPHYARRLHEIFTDAVHAIPDEMYSVAQKQAWAPRHAHDAQWCHRLELKQPFIALASERAVGFIELEANGHIDCLYVAPKSQRQGVASRLYTHLQNVARARQQTRLFVEASKAAKPFFEKRGFVLKRANKIFRLGETLTNYSLEKKLP